MSRLKIILGVLVALVVAQGIGLLLLGVLVYQTTPQSVLAHQTFIGRIPGMLASVRVFDRATNMFYWGPRPPAEIPHYDLRVDTDDLRTIEESLPSELPSPWYANLFLSEDAKVWVPATFTVNGEQYDVKIRVRGDIFNHWAYRKKSWRVRFDNDKLFQGKREINLIIPEDREWFAEPLNAYRAQKLGLLTTPMQFVTVSLNGVGPMLYTEIEHWGKEMLEKQSRPGDVNIYGADGGTSYFQQWDPAFDEVGYWSKYDANPTLPDTSEEIEQLNMLAREGAHAEPGFRSRLERVLDVDRVISWYTLALLAGSSHVDTFNLRFAFDTSRGRLEPIPWDISLYDPRTLLEPPGNPLLNEIFQLPDLKLATYKKVWEYISNEQQVQDDLAKTRELRALAERRAYRDPLKLQSNRQVRIALDRNEARVQANLTSLHDQLSLSEVMTVQRIPSFDQQQRGVALILDFIARGISPARFAEFKLPPENKALLDERAVEIWRDDGNGLWGSEDKAVPWTLRAEPDKNTQLVVETAKDSDVILWVGEPEIERGSGMLSAPHTRHRFFLVVRDGAELPHELLPLELDIRNAITGEKASVISSVVVNDQHLERLSEASLSKDAFLARNPAFRSGEGNSVVLRGNHVIDRTVIVPVTVRFVIDPGTVLRMGSGVSILSYAPVTMQGTEQQPIQIFPIRPEEPWGIFGVLNAKEPSTVQWLQASGGGEALINNTYFTGMIAFHGSPVTIADSAFRNAHGDDGLNLKYVYVDVQRSVFENNDWDGIDIDVPPAGTAQNLVFRNNGGDGLDLSWAPIIVRNIEVDGSGDKCISIGERSTPLVYDSILRGCRYGIAVKDDSHAKIERVIFEDNDIAISGYIKKPIFGPPSAVVNGSTFLRNKVKVEALSGAVITVDSAK